MRTLSLFAILLAFPAFAAERTWTIARDVYTAEAELIVVRGDLAYLKIDGQVEEIPIERLSAFDQQYIASLSLAPIAPGPQADAQESTTHSLLVQEEMPLPGEPDSPAVNARAQRARTRSRVWWRTDSPAARARGLPRRSEWADHSGRWAATGHGGQLSLAAGRLGGKRQSERSPHAAAIAAGVGQPSRQYEARRR